MRLSERRKAMGYSQEKFAHALGVDRTTVSRWERGETTPECVHRPKMAELLRLDITELGTMLARRPAHDAQPTKPPSRPVHGSGESDDMIRRKFLRLLTVSGALTALGTEAADDLAEAVERGSADDYRRMNAHLWQVYQLARSKRSVHEVVQGQLDALADALKSRSAGRHAGEMCEAAGDLFQLSGELAFDSNRYTDAAAAYTVAASASDSADAFDLWACALVRHAYVDMSEQHFAEAAETLDVARTIASRGDPGLSTRYWVASVQAEAHASLGDLDACRRALDEAEKVADLSGPVHNGGWLRFDGSRLAEERGARFVQLGRFDLAEEVLRSALGSTALAEGSSYRRRGSVLVDLALIGAERHDAEQVVTHGREALRLARQSGSGYVVRRLRTLRDGLGAYGHDRRVSELAADIGNLQAT